jgi:hypothetical protein
MNIRISKDKSVVGYNAATRRYNPEGSIVILAAVKAWNLILEYLFA